MKRIDVMALGFWTGVCGERLQHHESEVRFFAPFTREENKEVREWHRQRAEELRRWAREARDEWTRKGDAR